MHHDVLVFLLSLAALLGSARLLGEGARRLGFPAVVGEILAGVVVGKTLLGRFAPGAYGWLFTSEGSARTLLSGYTTVAVMLLLVVAGIEVDLTIVRRSGKPALLISALGALIPFALGFGVGMLLPAGDIADPSRRMLHAAFLGIALSISALPVIAKTLLDLGLLKTDLGLMVLSAAVVDDLAGWIGFSVLSRQFAPDHGATSLWLSVGLTLIFVVGTLLVVRPLVDRVLARLQPEGHRQGVDAEPSHGSVLTMVMILALLGAAATQALGMHAVFGGFIMGVAIGDSSRLREHTRTVLREFVTSIFTPVFFATIALRFDFAAHFDLSLVALVLAISCVAKVLGCAAGARLGGIRWREAMAIGFGMNSRGAMEILLAMLAFEAGIINERLFVALVIMAVVTSLISGPAMSRLLRPPPSPVLTLLREGVVRLDVAGEAPAQVIAVLGHALAERTGRPEDAARFAAAVLAREDLAGTGVGEGVAIPHAEIAGLQTPVLAFGRTATGVDFDSPDGLPVHLVFVLLTPPREFDRELQILAAIVRLIMHEHVRRALLDATHPQQVLDMLDDADRASPSLPSPRLSGHPAPPRSSA